MTKKVRGFSLLLIISLLFTICPGYAVMAEEPSEGVLPEILFKYTGDSAEDSVITSVKGSTTVVTEENDHKKVLGLDEGSTIYIDTGRDLASGSVVISWDFKADAFNESYARIYSMHSGELPNDADKMYDVMIYRTSGAIQPFKQLYNWQIDTLNASTYKKDEWHHMDLWFDLDKKVMEYYLNGEIFASIEAVDKFDKFCGFSMTHVNQSRGADVRFDNLAIGYVPKKGYKTGFDFCRYIPEEIEKPVNAVLTIDNIGHAFFDKNIEVNANLTNAHETEKNLSLSFKVYTESGKLKYEKTEDMVIKGSETVEKDYKFAVDEFGFYYVYLDILDKDSGEVFKGSTRFSYLNSPPDGVFNEKMGLNNHFSNNRGTNRMADFLDMMKNAGIKYTRETFSWPVLETSQGVYEIPYPYNEWLPKLQENNQKYFLIIGTTDFLYAREEVPISESQIGHWRDYVENMAIYGKQYGIEDFEIGNELNLTYNSGRLTAAQYVRLLKEAYTVIKRHLPDSRVYGFCTANVKAPEFIRNCLELGAGDYLDGISIHPYNVSYRPDEGPYLKDAQAVKDLMVEFGIENKSLVYSEFGWTCGPGYSTEDEQARYTVRAAAMAVDTADLICWYVSIDKIDLASLSERYFGMVRGWQGQEVNFEPKPVFLALSNYNAFVAEAESVGQQKIFDDGGYICKFKAKDNSDIYMIWKTRDDGDLLLDIGSSDATVYDMYGNPTKLKARNGVVELAVSEDPIYLTGNFKKCEEVKNGDEISIVETTIETTLSDSATINIIGGKPGYKVEAELPENIQLASKTGFAGGKANIKLKTGNNPGEAEKIKVSVKNQSGDVVYTKTLKVEYKAAITYDFSVRYYKSARWQGVLKLTNNNNDTAVTGTFTATSPTELVKYVGAKSIGKIGPKQTELLEFNIPTGISSGNLDLSGVLKLSTGEEIEIDETTYFTSLMPIAKTPTIDGKIDLGEYNTNAPIRINKDYMVKETLDWWGGTSDASAAAYINYDKDYFYLAAVATDNALGDNDEQGRIWANDSIQFAFANDNVSGSPITEIGIGLVNGEPMIERYTFLGTKQNIQFLENEEKEGFNNDMELQISRNGNQTVYELKLPWEDIYASTDDFNRKHIYFSVILNDNDGKGRLGWLEFCPGIGGVKNASLFSKVPVGRK